MKALRILFATLCFALIAGCSQIPYTVAKRSEIDSQIEAARKQTTEQLAVISRREQDALLAKMGTLETQRQVAANHLFKGLVVGGGLKTPTRPEMVMNQSIQQTATELPPATAAAQLAALTDLRRELDEARVSADELRAQYEKELGVARAEGAARAAKVVELDTKLKEAAAEKETVLGDALTKERALQAAKDLVQDKELAIQTAKTEEAEKDVERAKSVQAIKVKMSAVTGGLALLCIAGCIWSPLWKQKFAVGAVVFGVATAAIWYVQPWHIAIAVGLALLGLTIWAVKNHYIESRAATNVYRGIQSIKDRSKEEYDKVVRPALETWNTVYDKDGKPIPDEAAIKHIDKVLRDNGDL